MGFLDADQTVGIGRAWRIKHDYSLRNSVHCSVPGTVAIGCVPGSHVAAQARSADQAYIHTEGLMLAASAGACFAERTRRRRI
jgi:hypothetical protein